MTAQSRKSAPGQSRQPAPGLAARAAALDLLAAVLHDRRALDAALADHAGLADLAARDRAFTRRLVATCLRRLGEIDSVVARCLERKPAPRMRAARDMLRLGACQLLFLGTPAHAAVDGMVALAERRGQRPYKGLVNAVLRRVAREGAALREGLDAARVNTPDWLWKSWRAAYGAEIADAIATAHLTEPPLDVTPRDPRTADALAKQLEGDLMPTGSLRLAPGGRGRVADMPGFADGTWWVQDAAAALPARLLLGALPAGGRNAEVIDLCAAPGGKTAQLAAAGARVTAVERAAARRSLLEANLARVGLTAESVSADAAHWRPETPAEGVLLDAPCTATGTLRRHPDIARIKRPGDVARMAGLQTRLLAAAAEMLRPGGVLVYAVCSLQPEEGPERVAALLSTNADLARLPVTAAELGGLGELIDKAGDLRSLPCHLADRGGLDGFYAARLRRLG
ncbi:MAG: RsmB/NOP family class I SAM-dependent RNA methyltransferase [Alphaproteobacteria bacterium]